jgi:hypothetical protein
MIRLKSLITEEYKLPEAYVNKGVVLAKQLMQRGFTAIQAAAITGNAWAESSFNPAAEASSGDFGLLQWLGTRKKELKKFAKKRRTSPTDLNTQLDFIKYELLDSYDGEYAYETTMFRRAMASGESAAEKAYQFALKVERPRNPKKSKEARMAVAQQVYNALISKQDATTNTKKSSSAKITTNSGKIIYPLQSNGFVNVRDEDYVNNGVINNIINRVNYPNPVGVVNYEKTGQDGKIWYYVKLDTGGFGWVRSDSAKIQQMKFHNVQPGDTLTKIASKYKTTIDTLKQKNQLRTDTIQIGQKLKI